MDLQQRTTEYGSQRHIPKTEGGLCRLMNSTYRPGYKWGKPLITAIPNVKLVLIVTGTYN